MKRTSSSKLFFSLDAIAPQESDKGGDLIYVTAKEAPGLINISFAHLRLKKRGLLKPIWHPNANKVGYCVQGKGLVSLRTPEKADAFTIETGEMFFIPQGYVHQIENCGEQECVINFALNNTHPEVMSFAEAIYSISESVFKSTFNTPPGFIKGLKKPKDEKLITTLPQVKNVRGNMTSEYKFNIEKSKKPVMTQGGYLQIGTKKSLPVLQGLGILGFGLNPGGVVEPHWHTNAGELVYIVKGKTRITVLSPDGNVEVLAVNEGEGAFAPASHFHNIENIGKENVEVIAFFSHADPDYMGIGEVLGSYSNEELAAILNVKSQFFEAFKKPKGPLVIVPL